MFLDPSGRPSHQQLPSDDQFGLIKPCGELLRHHGDLPGSAVEQLAAASQDQSLDAILGFSTLKQVFTGGKDWTMDFRFYWEPKFNNNFILFKKNFGVIDWFEINSVQFFQPIISILRVICNFRLIYIYIYIYLLYWYF